MRRIIYLAIILVVFTIVLKAQDKKTYLPAFKDGEIVVKKVGSISSVEMNPSFIEFSENDKYNLFFIALFTRFNKFPTKSSLVTIAFYSNSKDCKFPEGSEITSEIVIDKKIFTIPNDFDRKKMLANGVSYGSYNEIEGDVCNGMFTMHIPQKTFIAFAPAKQVLIKIGDYKFELKPNNIKALSNLARLLIQKK